MLAPQAVFLLLLAASVIANSIGDGTRALSINVRRGAVSDGSPEDVASKLQWAKDELIRAGLKHPWRLSQEAQDNLVHEVSGMRKRATEAP